MKCTVIECAYLYLKKKTQEKQKTVLNFKNSALDDSAVLPMQSLSAIQDPTLCYEHTLVISRAGEYVC